MFPFKKLCDTDGVYSSYQSWLSIFFSLAIAPYQFPKIRKLEPLAQRRWKSLFSVIAIGVDNVAVHKGKRHFWNRFKLFKCVLYKRVCQPIGLSVYTAIILSGRSSFYKIVWLLRIIASPCSCTITMGTMTTRDNTFESERSGKIGKSG